MDGEVNLQGFSPQNIIKCSELFFKSKELSSSMLQQARKMGLYELLHIPIILLLSCVVYIEKNSLPRTRTEIYNTIFDILIDRTALKTFTPGVHADVKDFLEALLFTLGEFSWNSPQKDVGPLSLSKVGIQSIMRI